MKYFQNIYKTIPILTLFLLWELMQLTTWEYREMFPSPLQIYRYLQEHQFAIGLGSSQSTLHSAIIATLYRVSTGILLATGAAFISSILLKQSTWIRKCFYPIIQFIAPIAPIAWIPLALILFGIGNSAAIFIVFMGVFSIFTITLVQALSNIPEHYIMTGKTLGMNTAQLWRKIIFPALLPQIITMIRVNFIAAWMAVLAAEMTGLRSGLGAIIMMGRNLFNSHLIILGMILIGLIGFLIDSFLQHLQKQYAWW